VKGRIPLDIARLLFDCADAFQSHPNVGLSSDDVLVVVLRNLLMESKARLKFRLRK
jgi:hypothetical protein